MGRQEEEIKGFEEKVAELEICVDNAEQFSKEWKHYWNRLRAARTQLHMAVLKKESANVPEKPNTARA